MYERFTYNGFFYFLFFLDFPPCLATIGETNTEIVFSGQKYIDYIFLDNFWGSQASEMTNLSFFFVKHFFRANLLK